MFSAIFLCSIGLIILPIHWSQALHIDDDQKRAENAALQLLKAKQKGLDNLLQNRKRLPVAILLRNKNYGICKLPKATKAGFCQLGADKGETLKSKYSAWRATCSKRPVTFQWIDAAEFQDKKVSMIKCPDIEGDADKKYYLSRVDESTDKAIVYVRANPKAKYRPHRVLTQITDEDLEDPTRQQQTADQSFEITIA